MAAKDAVLKALVEGVITELMVKTTAGNVYMPDGTTTVAGKLAEMVTAINERAKSTDVTTEINTAVSGAIDDLIDGAPETYDTLKEIADYLATHQDEYTALLTTIGGKAEKATVEALQTAVNGLGALAAKDKVSEADLDTALAAKVNAAAQGNHSHTNKAVLDGITAEKVSGWDGKSKVTVGTTQPADMQPGDLFIQIS